MTEPLVLRREMGLRDITLFAITCVTSTRWVPGAAHAGSMSITLWLLAALLFAVPLAIAVGSLIVKYPGAGGLYLWTRRDFGPWHAFLCFWSYWVGIAALLPPVVLFYVPVGFRALGASAARLVDSQLWLVAASLVAIAVALGTNMVGVNIGKWTENLGAVATWTLAMVLAIAAAIVWARHGRAASMDLVPRWNWSTVNFWAGIAYALSGLELAGLMGAEIRDPDHNLPRAGWLASGFGVTFYAVSTASLLVILPPQRISEMTGYAQTADAAAPFVGAWLPPAIALLVLLSGIGAIGGVGTGTSRLPFAVGVDHLLPAAFRKIHPRWGTPHLSILALGLVSSFLLVVFQFGDSMRAAYQELLAMMVIAGFLPYLYIFGSSWKAGNRISAASGWSVTVLAIVCSVAPSDEIHNIWLYEGKLAAGTGAVIGSAWLLYRRAARRVAPQ
ncbi:MAG TPA: APC family permease [Candidatus Sulfopaludibacter sp.]|nr:APC family permease [Candidatus Sulfopaludibacter sp.]